MTRCAPVGNALKLEPEGEVEEKLVLFCLGTAAQVCAYE
jgi:hypothetical protein